MKVTKKKQYVCVCVCVCVYVCMRLMQRIKKVKKYNEQRMAKCSQILILKQQIGYVSTYCS